MNTTPPAESVGSNAGVRAGSRYGKLRALRASLTGHWQSAASKADVLWRGLAERERRLLLVCAVVVGGALCWLVAVKPAMIKISYWQSELPKLRSQEVAVAGVLSQVPPARPASRSAADIEAALNAQLRAMPMTEPYRLEGGPEMQGWVLTITEVPPQDLVPWLMQQPQKLGLVPVEVMLSQTVSPGARAKPGSLSGTVRLAPTFDVKDTK